MPPTSRWSTAGRSARCSRCAAGSARGPSRRSSCWRHHPAAQRAARHRHGRRPGAGVERAQTLAEIPESRLRRFSSAPRKSRAPCATRRSSRSCRRVARGHYEVEFVPLAAAGEQLPAGRIHGALRAHGRGADPRGARRLAVVAQALEAQKASVRRLISAPRFDLTRGGDAQSPEPHVAALATTVQSSAAPNLRATYDATPDIP